MKIPIAVLHLFNFIVMASVKNSSAFLSVLLGIYFGALFPATANPHKLDPFNEVSQFQEKAAESQSHYSGDEKSYPTGEHLLDIQYSVCDELEERKKFIKKSNLYFTHINFVSGTHVLSSKNHVKSIIYRLTPPLRGPPPV